MLNVKACVAAVPTPLLAVTVNLYCPAGAAVVLIKTPADVSVTPVGSVPVAVKVGAGKPVALNVNDPAVPPVNVAVAAVVIAGA